eukprot:gene23252-biopygen8844
MSCSPHSGGMDTVWGACAYDSRAAGLEGGRARGRPGSRAAGLEGGQARGRPGSRAAGLEGGRARGRPGSRAAGLQRSRRAVGETAADVSRTCPTRRNLKKRTRPGRVLGRFPPIGGPARGGARVAVRGAEPRDLRARAAAHRAGAGAHSKVPAPGAERRAGTSTCTTVQFLTEFASFFSPSNRARWEFRGIEGVVGMSGSRRGRVSQRDPLPLFGPALNPAALWWDPEIRILRVGRSVPTRATPPPLNGWYPPRCSPRCAHVAPGAGPQGLTRLPINGHKGGGGGVGGAVAPHRARRLARHRRRRRRETPAGYADDADCPRVRV